MCYVAELICKRTLPATFGIISWYCYNMLLQVTPRRMARLMPLPRSKPSLPAESFEVENRSAQCRRCSGFGCYLVYGNSICRHWTCDTLPRKLHQVLCIGEPFQLLGVSFSIHEGFICTHVDLVAVLCKGTFPVLQAAAEQNVS